MTVPMTSCSQTRGFINMLGGATKKTEKAATQAAEAAQSTEHGDIVLGTCLCVSFNGVANT